MKEHDEIKRLNERVKALEQELRAAKQVAWMGLTAAMWRHSLDGKAINIRNCVELIRRVEAGGLTEQVDKYLNWINEIAATIIDTPINPLPSTEVPSISVGDYLAEYVSRLHERNENSDLDVRLESSVEARVKIDYVWLHSCIDLIVENADEAMRDSPEKILTISTALADDSVEILISDTGPGVSEALRSRIFLMPVGEEQRKGHLGFGLLIAKTFVQAFGGDIRLDEAKQGGATFIISLPKA